MSGIAEAQAHPKQIVEAVLGEDFTDIESLRAGSWDSGHGVRFGDYRVEDNDERTVRIAAKPYYGRKAPDNSHRELVMTNRLKGRGFSTLEPLGALSLTEARQPQNYMAVFMTRYIGAEYYSANTMTLEEDPVTDQGRLVASAVCSIALELAELHNELVTHGDPKVKNFMLKRHSTLGERPVVIDAEKTNTHDSKRSPGSLADKNAFSGGIRRDLRNLSYSLGSRQYGLDDQSHFLETVIEPYMERLTPKTRGMLSFLPITLEAFDNFKHIKHRERVTE